MSRYSLNPDRLFDRPWRPGHPFHPKSGRLRRLSTAGLLVFLCGVIWTYGYLTDAKRVRDMAQGYLSGLVGGRVTVEGASLSIFEGLRLDGVKVFVDAPVEPGGPPALARKDSLLFSAKTFVVQYDPRSMLGGRLEAGQIVAEQPQVHLSRDVTTDHWNFQRLGQSPKPRPAPAPGPPPPAMALPEVLLRNARVEINDLLADGTQVTRGYMAIDGRFSPPPAPPAGSGEARRGGYDFVLQSRGASDAMGPLVSGSVDPGAGRVSAKLDGFQFGPDVRAMLPDDVGKLLERLEMTGEMNVDRLTYAPAGADGKGPKFGVEMALKQVNFSVPPEQWMSKAEAVRREDARQAALALRQAFAAGGFGRQPLPSVTAAFAAADPSAARPPGVAHPTASADVSATSDAMPASAVLAAQVATAAAGPMAAVPRPPTNPADALAALYDTAPVRFRQVNGTFAFDERGVQIRDLHGRVESNPLTINGHIDGYDPDAPMSLTVTSSVLEDLSIPAAPRYIWSLPAAVREFYEKTRPQGTCRLNLNVTRKVESGPIDASGYVDLVDAQFVFDEFPYPIRQTQGRVEVARDPATGLDYLLLRGVRGHGFEGGPNQDKSIGVDGWIGPLNVPNYEPGGVIKVIGKDIRLEPPLSAAFDNDVREALALFDAPGKGHFPAFHGDFLVEVYKPVGAEGKFKVKVDLDVAEADGQIVGFPYPLRGLAGRFEVRDGFANVVWAKLRKGDATVDVSGKVAWKLPNAQHLPPELAKRRTDLALTVRGMPVDDDLLSALPPDASDWIRKNAVQGKVDVDGRLTGGEGGLPAKAGPDESDLAYDLNVGLRDATARPECGKFEVAGVTGRMRLTPGKLDVLDVRGRRGQSALSTIGQVTWAGGRGRKIIVTSFENLPLDRELYELLPTSARAAWDEVQPKGTIDGEVSDAGDIASVGGGPATAPSQADAVTVVDLSRPAGQQSTRPTALMLELPEGPGRPAVSREIPAGVHATLRPRVLSATVRTLPYELSKLTGEIAVGPQRVELRGLTGHHGKATLTVSGTGTPDPTSRWDLKVSAKDVPVDADLRKALPPTLTKLIDSLDVKGTLGLELDQLSYRSGGAVAARRAEAALRAGEAPPAAGATLPEPEIDLGGRLALADVSLDAGAKMQKVQGSMGLAATIRGGQLYELGGRLDVASLDVAGRSVTDLRAELSKPGGGAELYLRNLRASIGGGDLAGDATLVSPDAGGIDPATGASRPADPGQYKLSLFVRNADVRELAKDSGENLNGRATASLALEGAWGQVAARRGRGDVLVAGREMYRIPLVLGLMQVTNLSLPITSPFSSATARYSVDGQRVTFERIELRSNNLLMSGDGSLDFGTKQVRMQFVTDNPAAFKVPFLHDILRGAQQELVRIQVRGTVEDPQVQNRPLGTFTTTVDQVFRGDAKNADGPKTKATKK